MNDEQEGEMRMIGERAVVLGAGIGGLLAARALADAYEQVTVIDRDALPAGVAPRRAVPQGRHVHALLPSGQGCMEQLLPGLSGELLADGAVPYRALTELRFMVGGHWLARGDVGRDSLVASRPFIEGHVRRRVRALENVGILDRCDAAGLTTDGGGERITGVRVLRREPGSAAETLSADLVVAATGRSARLASWLEELGYARPAEERLDVDLGYASVALWLPSGALGADKLVLIGARPDLPRSLGLFAQEHGRWLLTVGGYAGHHPPSDLDGLMRFAASVAPLDVTAALRAAEPLGEIASFRFPANLRRFYERMPRRPAGLVPLGDAICAFNPIYGQGMSVAAGQAVALRRSLAAGPEQLERRYLSAAAKIVDHAWQLTAGADLALPVVAGPRPARTRLVNAYLRRLHAGAARDEALAAAFMRVSGMLDRPPALLRPAVVRRVVRPRGHRRRGISGLLRVGGIATPLRQAGPAGDSEAVVFVHGNPGSGADFEPLLAAVAERGLRAVAWDAPGFGRADAPSGFAQTVPEHAAFIAHALDSLGITRAHLVLHDFGGPWGLRWAVGDPERFATATLLNTGALPGYSWHALARLWRTPLAGELFMATTSRAGFRLLLRRGQPRPLPRAFVDRMYDDFDPATRRAVLDLYRSLDDVGAAGDELARALAPLDRPALVLWGRHDPYIGVQHAQRERLAFPHAEVRVLDRAGHWPYVEHPNEVAAAITAFLARHTGASALAARPALTAADAGGDGTA